jgi:hypothetical protein
MLTLFESLTGKLTNEEIATTNIIVAILTTKNKNNSIKSRDLIKLVNNQCAKKGLPNLKEPRLRACVNYIRRNSILPIIASSKGYYSSHKIEDMELQIKSLTERANSILSCASGLQKIVDTQRKKNKIKEQSHDYLQRKW